MSHATDYPLLQWTEERVRLFWDWQSRYPEVYLTYQYGGRLIAALRADLGSAKNACDYGCGTGYLLPHISRAGIEAYGADYSPDSVDAARRHASDAVPAENISLISDLLASARQFDAILSIEVVEHLDDPALEEMLANVKRLLAPGGRFVATTPNNERLEDSFVICPASGEVFHRWQHVRSWTAESLRSRLEQSGLRVLEVRETDPTVGDPRSPKGFLRLLHRHFVVRREQQPKLVAIATA